MTWFVDTGFLIAVASKQDQHHASAQTLLSQLKKNTTPLLTTDAVLFEVGAAFSKVAMRQQGIKIIEGMLQDPTVQVVNVTPMLRHEALTLYRNFADKDWSLCDCLSFVVMRQHSITQALTPDHHFEQAGLQALMLNAR
jgi:uncharacterized protein